MAERRPTRAQLVLKGLVEQDDPRAFYRGSWFRTHGHLVTTLTLGLTSVSFGRWAVTDLGLDTYVCLGLWAVRHG